PSNTRLRPHCLRAWSRTEGHDFVTVGQKILWWPHVLADGPIIMYLVTEPSVGLVILLIGLPTDRIATHSARSQREVVCIVKIKQVAADSPMNRSRIAPIGVGRCLGLLRRKERRVICKASVVAGCRYGYLHQHVVVNVVLTGRQLKL